jgi:hypothetical protein
VPSGVDGLNFGVGLGFFRFWGAEDQRVVMGVTPRDDERSVVFHTVWLGRDGDRPAASAVDEEGRLGARVELNRSQFLADLEIWRHLRYAPRPGLSRQETRGFTAVRRWARRFYPDALEYRDYERLLEPAG